MRIKLEYSEDDARWYEPDYPCDMTVEVPDAIVADWRETRKHLDEIDAWFEENVQPQIREYHRLKHEAWRKANPEKAKMHDAMIKMWSNTLMDKVAGDTILYSLTNKKIIDGR